MGPFNTKVSRYVSSELYTCVNGDDIVDHGGYTGISVQFVSDWHTNQVTQIFKGKKHANYPNFTLYLGYGVVYFVRKFAKETHEALDRG